MLEFLGMQDEVQKVMMACIAIGIAIGLQAGAITAYGDKESKNAGKIIFLVFCIISGGIAFLYGIIPGILLFFTFQWKYIIFALLAGGIAAFPAYLLSKTTVLCIRRKRYMRNPIVKEAVQFCKKNKVVGVQCFPDGLRFFTAIEHPGYCKKDVLDKKFDTEFMAKDYQSHWKRPDSWVAYDMALSHIHTLRFADRDFPNVPDLPMFGSALAKKLRFACAAHSCTLRYDTTTHSGSTTTITHHTLIIHEDCFVYSPKAYHTCLQAWKQAGLLQKEKPAPEKPVGKPKSWE